MRKILLIEDHPDMRENTAEILELANFEVDTAENGKIGVEKAKSTLPDLIICDIMMPELDGYGVLFLLSKDPATASIPFIFLTAKAEKSDMRKGMGMGADDYITKPFEETELLQAIDGRLKKSDAFKKEYENNAGGLNDFMTKAKGFEELKELSTNQKFRTYKKREVIFHEGDFANGIYFLSKGKVKTYKMNEDGKEFITELYKEGDFLGYLDILTSEEFSESAAAMEDVELCRIPKDDFLALMHNNRDVANRFIKMLSNNLIEKERNLLNLAYDTVRKRVADALIKLRNKYNKEGDGNFTMAIPRDDLASMVGTTTESVIRTLSEFKQDGFIEIQASKITIKQVEALAKLRY